MLEAILLLSGPLLIQFIDMNLSIVSQDCFIMASTYMTYHMLSVEFHSCIKSHYAMLVSAHSFHKVQ